MDVKINSDLINQTIEYRGYKVRFEPWFIDAKFGVKLEAKIDSTINLVGAYKEWGNTHFHSSTEGMVKFWGDTLSDEFLWSYLITPSAEPKETYVTVHDSYGEYDIESYAEVVGHASGHAEVARFPFVESVYEVSEQIMELVKNGVDFKLSTETKVAQYIAYKKLALDPTKKHQLMIVGDDYPEDKVIGVIATHRYEWEIRGLVFEPEFIFNTVFPKDLEKYNEALDKHWGWRFVITPPSFLPSYRQEVVKNMAPLTDEQLEQELPNIFETIDEMAERNKKYFNQL